MSAFTVRRLETVTSREFGGLCEVLIDCVEGGASVSFMHPMTLAKAADFWREVAASTPTGTLLTSTGTTSASPMRSLAAAYDQRATMRLTSRYKAVPAATPAPTTAIVDSIALRRTSLRCAPSAMRSANSLVRCATV